MAMQASTSACQRGLNYAIVDEVDSILIDEARTPLIISGQAEDHTELYYRHERARAASSSRQEEEKGAGRLLGRREGAPGAAVRGGPRARRGDARARRACCPTGASLYDAANITLMHHLYAALRAHSLYPPRPALRGAGRRGRHRRRVHRPPDAGPALVRRPAPGGRGEGEASDPEREPDARLDHVPELLPHVRQARRHDRHGRHRGLRVPADLRPGDGGDPDAQADGPRGPRTTRSTARAKEKYEAIIDDIKDCYERGQPVLVGTTSIENSELLSAHAARRRSCRTRC